MTLRSTSGLSYNGSPGEAGYDAKAVSNKVNELMNANEQKIYKVVAGDNLTKIANKFDTTVDSLVVKNGIKDPDLIYVG